MGTTVRDSPADELGTTPAATPVLGTAAPAEELSNTEPAPDADLGTTPAPARPHRLPDGAWGVVSPRPLARGDLVTVTTSGGQCWTATVTEVLEQTERGTVARTSGRPT